MRYFTREQYAEWMKLPDWTIINDPPQYDLENSDNEYYYTDDMLAKTPYGIIILQKGHRINGASIPWYCQGLIPKSGKWNRSAGYHDDGYKYGGFFIIDEFGNITFIKLSQKKIDYAYLKFMAGRKVKKWIMNAQYRMLRMLGWYTWNQYRKQDKKRAA